MSTADVPPLSYSSAPGRWVLAITGSVYLHPHAFAAGFRTAVLISGGLCTAGGLLAAVTITNPRKAPGTAGAPASEEYLHCGLEAPPLTTSVSRATGA